MALSPKPPEESERDMLISHINSIPPGRTKPKLTDYNNTSVTKRIFRSISQTNYSHQLEYAAGFLSSAKQGVRELTSLPRRPASPSTTQITFTRTEDTGSTTTIPQGTIVTTEDSSIRFATDNEAILPQTINNTVSVDATSLDLGAEQNTNANTLTRLEQDIAGVEVNNIFDAKGGGPEETLQELENRLRTYLRGQSIGNRDSLESAILSDPNLSGLSEVYIRPYDGSKASGFITITNTSADNDIYIPSGTTIRIRKGQTLFLSYKTQTDVTVHGTDPLDVQVFAEVGGNIYNNIDKTSPVNSFYSPLTSANLRISASGDGITGGFNGVPGRIRINAFKENRGVLSDRENSIIRKISEGDPNDIEKYPGKVPAGITVDVINPKTQDIFISAIIDIPEGSATENIKSNIIESIRTKINTHPFGQDISISDLIATIENSSEFIEAVSIEEIKYAKKENDDSFTYGDNLATYRAVYIPIENDTFPKTESSLISITSRTT